MCQTEILKVLHCKQIGDIQISREEAYRTASGHIHQCEQGELCELAR